MLNYENRYLIEVGKVQDPFTGELKPQAVWVPEDDSLVTILPDGRHVFTSEKRQSIQRGIKPILDALRFKNFTYEALYPYKGALRRASRVPQGTPNDPQNFFQDGAEYFRTVSLLEVVFSSIACNGYMISPIGADGQEDKTAGTKITNSVKQALDYVETGYRDITGILVRRRGANLAGVALALGLHPTTLAADGKYNALLSPVMLRFNLRQNSGRQITNKGTLHKSHYYAMPPVNLREVTPQCFSHMQQTFGIILPRR